MATLSNFKSALQYGGARPSLFDMTIFDPISLTGVDSIRLQFHCNISAIPPLTVTPIERQYFGRTVKIPGDIVFGDLSTTIINAEDYKVRNSIEAWMDNINTTGGNTGLSDNDSWVSSATLRQYGKDGIALIDYDFWDIWPTTISEIALSYDTASDIEQFDVTWAYNYYETASQGSNVVKGTQS